MFAMDDKKVRYLPFHAVNEFMIPEYRLSVLQRALSGADKLSGERKSSINKLIKRLVSVPGFRNSAQSPRPLKIRASVTAFEKNSDFAAQIMMAWSELNPELRQQVYEFLKGRNWELLPPEADRTKLPGFMITWPKSDSFEIIDKLYAELHPENSASEDDIRLMVVWLSGRLPYEMTEEETQLE
jgi:hypothetical protein